MSFSQALSGLNAQSQKLGAIGNNIANSQTVGFKSSNVQFADVFANSRVGLGTRVSAVLQNFNEGNIESTSRNLDLAVAGEGFFRFMDTSGQVVYSRNGQLTMTAEGELINAQGFQIMGYGVNAQGEVQVGGQPVPLTVDSDELGASATTGAGTVLNLDSRMNTGEELSVTELADGTEISYHYANNFTVYDSLGNPVNTSVYYEKVSENLWQAKVVADGEYVADNDFMLRFNSNGTLVGAGDPLDMTLLETLEQAEADIAALQVVENEFQSLGEGGWDGLDDAGKTAYLEGLDDSNPVVADMLNGLSDASDWAAIEDALQIATTDAQAARDTANQDVNTALAGLTGSQVALTFVTTSGAEDINFNLNLAGSTQFGNNSTVSSLTQNGYTSGALVGITIDENGVVMRNYSNEESRPAGQIALAHFRNPEGLTPAGDNVWYASAQSGQELVGAPGTGMLGAIVAGAVETSNVDMAGELVNMIIAQRAYQANSQTIKTQDEILQTAINLR
ncbi:MAG TPA: flagellar hook protein FlgE [Candidatus Halomonas stercoripullorum]|uniref:Flagellar hook protein FlgE n=1 Tax=Candidatus Halomonas stercoripullorum TaxID=2838617 RepID=A0A9D1WL62_9GAMM|nr:flagellar hook protein FlgE [Candidatus Halomonas stercoripullorum]